MSTAVLGDPIGVADSVDRLCDDILEVFESDETSDRARAVEVCATCPLLQACRNRTRVEILDGRGPCAVVRAGVAWDYDGYPDADVPTNDTTLAWLPPGTAKRPEHEDGSGSDLDRADENVVELAFYDPGLLREHEFSVAESEAIVLRGAKQGKSMNFLGKILRMHYRNVHKMALNLGVRDAFGTKPKRHKTLDETLVELDALVNEHGIDIEAPVREVDKGQLSFYDLSDADESTARPEAVTAAVSVRSPRALLLRRITGRIPRRFRAGKLDLAKLVQRSTPSTCADSAPAAGRTISCSSLGTYSVARRIWSDSAGGVHATSPRSADSDCGVMHAPRSAGPPPRRRWRSSADWPTRNCATGGADPPRFRYIQVSTSGCCGGLSSRPAPPPTTLTTHLPPSLVRYRVHEVITRPIPFVPSLLRHAAVTPRSMSTIRAG
ncbi:hypothetical protein [Rhodococcus opacus]|uniref:hypothetical protein n=1 Tax=Rhodococcus opacus TaxID=37919 RepID=UPI0002EE053B|nr:hypothetical protein [Rhodococcus opacus]CAG7637333.1 hypothetical protein E143388_07884 [Rhodococcus opacus]